MDKVIKLKRQRLALSDSILSVGQLFATRLDSFIVEEQPYEPRSFERLEDLVEV